MRRRLVCNEVLVECPTAQILNISERMDETYFSSYASLSVHELMLKDAPRTEAYKSFIEKNASAIKDKIVIDVGAGTGI